MTNDVVINLVYAFVILEAIHELGRYARLRLRVLRKPLIERRADTEASTDDARMRAVTGRRV